MQRQVASQTQLRKHWVEDWQDQTDLMEKVNLKGCKETQAWKGRKQRQMQDVQAWHQTHNESSSWRGPGKASEKGKTQRPRKYGLTDSSFWQTVTVMGIRFATSLQRDSQGLNRAQTSVLMSVKCALANTPMSSARKKKGRRPEERGWQRQVRRRRGNACARTLGRALGWRYSASAWGFFLARRICWCFN